MDSGRSIAANTRCDQSPDSYGVALARGAVSRVGFPSREEEFTVSPNTTADQIIDAYWQQAKRTEGVVRSAPDLGVPCLGDEGGRGAAHILLGFDGPVDLRWVLLHVIEETAHHAGHAD